MDSNEGIHLPDPVTMLLLLDDELLSGQRALHKWQIQHLLDFALEHTKDIPFRSVVQAANGSGKDKYIIAPESVWLAMRYPHTVCVITSSSGPQLDKQTNTYIKQLCEACNKKFGMEVWKINYRHYECITTGSTIELFATDEAGRAEGWHPIVADGKLAIFVSEDKSVSDDIDRALNRCTGYTHRVHVSSPGLPVGHFFDRCQLAKRREELTSIDKVNDWIRYKVTAYECEHITPNEIEEIRKSNPKWFFDSAVLAEFGTTDEMTVINYSHVWQAIHKHLIGHLEETFNTGGLDLSAGGDETVLCVRNGNKLIAIEPFNFKDTQLTVLHLEKLFHKHQLANTNSFIYADAGGLGKPIVDQLRSRGWGNIRYVLNQGTPRDSRVYKNRGAEMWFNFGKLCESGEVWLLNDDKLQKQLATRYYRQTETNKAVLESKLQARAKGHPSPDRADACVLCYSQYKTKLADTEPTVNKPPARPEIEPVVSSFSQLDYAKREAEPKNKYERTGEHQFDIYRMLVNNHNQQIKQVVK